MKKRREVLIEGTFDYEGQVIYDVRNMKTWNAMEDWHMIEGPAEFDGKSVRLVLETAPRRPKSRKGGRKG